MTRTTPELGLPLQTFAPHQHQDVWPPTYDLTRNRPTNTADLQWNRVPSLGPSVPGAETLPLSHRDLLFCMHDIRAFLIWLAFSGISRP
ncbi:hypothetical protein AVEN_203538-1 [Araneus ventricosus]|uniref:Uncharacterized protein n=1 Tax=Araneus ventricosus TaxID=182803 RepID=A0A4Y2KDV6_ARAVE|nr:hypothetical protein AVEN_66239-1 [Araneus ventricosus]GBN00498.1 hypothetical protein AVEN_118871-1 [Araneus ventricosus]GBN02539.1 hypothetical protein AVEN_24566-1 [Araneus ventricosus]GBN02589.1 hypothetical protein AVEN_203538-1 [Araneus ventricosus]